ncbi:MAG: hypothetical protein LBU83_13705 [Bacteroidales bacterium]|jgi:hypothetical protein|nr:hypothetical protein [Bacteroidales bacterium]
MKQTILITLLFLFIQCNATIQQTVPDDIPTIFSEIKSATKKNKSLWDKDLYGAILLIDPQTRQIFANEPDETGLLKPDGSIYTGILPENISFANTAIDWNGKSWAMICLPLPEDEYERIDLLSHELFHKAQPSLGFTLNNADNNHLDLKDGRIYIRLELEALKRAIQSSSEEEKQQHLTDALVFRKYRNLLYPETDAIENLLELNEGIASYTGLIISGRNEKQSTEYIVNGINYFYNYPTFVRSFAYFTIPAYGYLLYNKDKNWNKNIKNTTDLADFFTKAFNINVSTDLAKTVEIISDNYNGKSIIQEETDREENNRKIIAEYKSKFIEMPHFELQFENMSISFDPRNIMGLEDKGTVYPNIRITDKWGILTVENGALMSPNWDKITITNPINTENKKISGDGWTLELSDGYILEKEETNGNYKLIKNVKR